MDEFNKIKSYLGVIASLITIYLFIQGYDSPKNIENDMDLQRIEPNVIIKETKQDEFLKTPVPKKAIRSTKIEYDYKEISQNRKEVLQNKIR